MKSSLLLSSLRTVSGRLLCVWLVTVGVLTLAPFDFDVMPVEHGRPFQYGIYQQDPVDFVFNLLLFVPVGALLHHATKHRTERLGAALRFAALTGLLVSAGVEYLQVFLASRDSSLLDVLANTSGSLAGVLADRAWGANFRPAVDSVRARVSPMLLGGLLGVVGILALSTSAVLQARTRLTNWNQDYPLLIGNELTADRPWRGQVFAFEMTDAATPVRQVRRFAAGESVALGGASLASFRFVGRGPYEDRSGHNLTLDWTAEPPAETSDGAAVSGAAWLRTTTAASGVVMRVREVSAFTLRLVCATSDFQTGPARIVSNSLNTQVRNFTVGQSGHDLVVRLRTPATGTNGYPLEFVAPGVFSGHGRRDILITYDGAALLASVAGRSDIIRAEVGPGASAALAVAPYNVDQAELEAYNLSYAAGLFVMPGVLLGVLGSGVRQRAAFGGMWLAAFVTLLEVTLSIASGRSFDLRNVALTGTAGSVVLFVVIAVLTPAAQGERLSAWAIADRAHIRS